jgi:Tfp pilus assembly PilM family ATPase
MILDQEGTLLGLDIVGNSLRLVEAENLEGKTSITAVANATLDLPFDYYAIGNEDFIPRFASAINSLIDKAGVNATIAHFALERRMLLIKRFTMDKGLSDADLRQQIEWELEQILVSSRDEYNIGCDRQILPAENFENVIVVAVRKAIILYIKEIFSKTQLKLAAVDVDLFAAIRALCASMQPNPPSLAALVDFNERGIDFGLIKDGKYAYSSEIPTLRSNGDRINYLDRSGEATGKVINDELIRLVENIGDSSTEKSLEKIFLTGDKADLEIIPHLQSLQKKAQISFADPFQNIEKRLDEEAGTLANQHPEMFLASVGMIL